MDAKRDSIKKPVFDRYSSSDSEDNKTARFQSSTLTLEKEIMETLDTTGVYNMRDDIHKYITNHV
jgi:hypothetical protein